MNLNQLVWVCPEPSCQKVHAFTSLNQRPGHCSEEKTFTHDNEGNEYDEPKTEIWNHDPPVLCILMRVSPETKPELVREWMQMMEPLKIQDSRR